MARPVPIAAAAGSTLQPETRDSISRFNANEDLDEFSPA